MVPSDLYCRFLQFGFINAADSSFHTSQRYVLIFQKWWSSGAMQLPCLHWKDPSQGCDLSRRRWNKPKKLSCMITLGKVDLEEKLSSGLCGPQLGKSYALQHPHLYSHQGAAWLHVILPICYLNHRPKLKPWSLQKRCGSVSFLGYLFYKLLMDLDEEVFQAG